MSHDEPAGRHRVQLAFRSLRLPEYATREEIEARYYELLEQTKTDPFFSSSMRETLDRFYQCALDWEDIQSSAHRNQTQKSTLEPSPASTHRSSLARRKRTAHFVLSYTLRFAFHPRPGGYWMRLAQDDEDMYQWATEFLQHQPWAKWREDTSGEVGRWIFKKQTNEDSLSQAFHITKKRFKEVSPQKHYDPPVERYEQGVWNGQQGWWIPLHAARAELWQLAHEHLLLNATRCGRVWIPQAPKGSAWFVPRQFEEFSYTERGVDSFGRLIPSVKQQRWNEVLRHLHEQRQHRKEAEDNRRRADEEERAQHAKERSAWEARMRYGNRPPPEVVQAFQTLQIELTASPQTIRRRYRDLAREVRPDVGGNHDQMVKVNQAYAVALEWAKYQS